MTGFDATGHLPVGAVVEFHGKYFLAALPVAFVVAGKTAGQLVSRFATKVTYVLTGFTSTGKAGLGFLSQTMPFVVTGYSNFLVKRLAGSLFIRNVNYVLQQVRKSAPTLDD